MVWQQETRTAYEGFLARNNVVSAVIVAFFILLSGRLFFLQVVRGLYFSGLSERQRTKIIIEHAPRGSIFDRAGRLLLGTRTNYAALFYPFAPSAGAPDPVIIEQLRAILGRDPGPALAQSLRSGQVVKLADNLTRDQMFRIEEKRLIMPGLSIVREPHREYVDPDANAHLVGYLSEVTARELESSDDETLRMGDMIGRGGLELYYDRYLRGRNGGLQIEVDVLGHQTRLVRHIGTMPGSTLITTIDADLQRVAAEALKASPTGRGAVVGIDPRTGAVRVLVSSPNYDPDLANTSAFAKFLRDRRLPLFNRAVQALYSPGSTFKIVTMTAALADRHVDPSQSYLCPGSFAYGKKNFSCWYKKGHGMLMLIPALASSCNVYFYQLALKVGPSALARVATGLGLGRKTGIDIPSEKSGLIPTVEWKKRRLHAPWQPGDTINMGIGQGPVWITPVQMAVMIAAVASRGRMYRPYIVERITDEDGADVIAPVRQTPVVVQDISGPVWDIMHRGLAEVVAWGTGKGCRLPGVAVAGKTGTAQNPHGKDHAWFVSYAPAQDPELALAVLVENGGAGGAVAVPVARRVYEEYFKVHLAPAAVLPVPAGPVDESVEEKPLDDR